ncbi:MAG TPA: VanZ family protein [Acidimicrobiia bacterium]|nr:VanZ family protein [Acidimicrobiia bacterium]
MSFSFGRRFGAVVSPLLAVAWALTYLYLGLTSSPPALPLGGRPDLVAHLGASAVLAVLVADALPGVGSSRWAAAAVLASLVGLAVEVFQTEVPNRDFDWLDLVTDAVGAIAGATVHRAASFRLERRALSATVTTIGVAALTAAGLILLRF